MYFNSLDKINFTGFISDDNGVISNDNDLQDLKIIEDLSKGPNKVLFGSMIVILGGFYLFL